MNNNIFELYGLKTEDKRQVTLERCLHCNNILKPFDRFCSQCSLIQNQSMADEIKMAGEKVLNYLSVIWGALQAFVYLLLLKVKS